MKRLVLWSALGMILALPAFAGEDETFTLKVYVSGMS